MHSSLDSSSERDRVPLWKRSANDLWLERCARALLLAVLSLLTLSALQVSLGTGLPGPDWAQLDVGTHRALAGFVVALSVTLVILAKRQSRVPGMAPLSMAILAIVLAQAALGMLVASLGKMALVGVTQAVLTHALVTAVAVATLWINPAWREPPVLVENEFRPSLVTMAWWPALLVAVQIVLGSAYRHGLIGVIPHLAGALLVAGLLTMAGLMVATAYPGHRILKKAAVRVVWLMAAQVVLGLVALAFRAGAEGWNQHLVFITVAHVVLGSLTMAACVVLALVIQKHVTDVVVAHAPSGDNRNAEGRTGARSI